MKLAGRIPVQPLDEERLTNIERRVVAGAADAAVHGLDLRAPHRGLVHALVAAAIAAAGVAGWLLHGAPADTPVAELPPFRVQTQAQRSVLDIGDARITSEPDTALAITRPGGSVVIAMTRGRVALEVDKRGTRPPLIVRAGDTDVVVVGTRFSVDYGDGSGDVDVSVTEGAVRVLHQQQETRVAAGQSWHTGAKLIAQGEPPKVPDSGAPPPPSPWTPSGMESASGTIIKTAPLDRIPEKTPPELARDHRATLPGTSSRVDGTAAGSGASPPPRERPRPRIVVPPDPQVGLKTAIRAQPVEPALDIGQPNPAQAIARYYDIAAHRSGDEASAAFYSIAAVRYLRLGLNIEALQTLDAYVRRFPGGKEYRAALWLRVRILCLDKIDDRCRAAAYTYLHEAPDSAAAHTAELITQAE